MEIPREQAEKLKRYFTNADPFLWGVLENKNKKGRLQELRKLGFLMGYSEGSNAAYSKINQDLLVELGIEGILEHIIGPKITNGFAPEVLRYFRRCWEQGQTPDMKYLKERKLYRRHIFAEDKVYDGRQPRVVGHKDPAHLFVQIDTQHNFVERWTVFAGLWFEEIEPLFGSAREDIAEGSK
ncbi:hypothetical protein H8D57_03330 [bacterium]|nr:hypothetical protein [bacterium]